MLRLPTEIADRSAPHALRKYEIEVSVFGCAQAFLYVGMLAIKATTRFATTDARGASKSCQIITPISAPANTITSSLEVPPTPFLNERENIMKVDRVYATTSQRELVAPAAS